LRHRRGRRCRGARAAFPLGLRRGGGRSTRVAWRRPLAVHRPRRTDRPSEELGRIAATRADIERAQPGDCDVKQCFPAPQLNDTAQSRHPHAQSAVGVKLNGAAVGQSDPLIREFDVRFQPRKSDRTAPTRDTANDEDDATAPPAQKQTKTAEPPQRIVAIPGYGRDLRMRASGGRQLYEGDIVPAWGVKGAQNKQHDTAGMQFYAGMANAAAARLFALRGENHNAARAGVRARDHFLSAKTLDVSLADADMGLGLYNYYVDTLSAMARVMRFFMGIPGGSKQEGVRLLEHAIADGVLTPNLARFYLALNLHRYDLQYEKALGVVSPLAEKYPANPLFQLARGDLYAKLGRKEKALACYRAAGAVAVPDAECQSRVRELVRVSIEALGTTKGR